MKTCVILPAAGSPDCDDADYYYVLDACLSASTSPIPHSKRYYTIEAAKDAATQGGYTHCKIGRVTLKLREGRKSAIIREKKLKKQQQNAAHRSRKNA